MRKNNTNGKKLKIISPMILSMILLVTFVGYWLNNQYYNEKKNLQNDLGRLYHTSNQDAEFILFFKNTIKPALNFKDTTNFNKLKIGTDKTSSTQKKEFTLALNQFINSDKKHYQNLFKTIESDLMIPDSLKGDNLYDIYRIGYKYQIYSRVRIYPNNENTIDTSYQFFQSLFLRELNKKHPGINIKKTKKIEDINSIKAKKFKYELLARGKLGILMYRNHPNKVNVILFDNYFFYLITIILPQIIFGIVLISLSVFALVFAYRSYLTQARLNMLRSDFVSNITHELKIPVATAKAAMEAILSFGITDDKEKTKSYLQMVSSEMNRLDHLTTRVLEQSRLENHQYLLHKKETNMNDFLERIVESIQLFYANSLQIKYQKPIENIKLIIDQVYIEGVIRNLIENSKKYGGNNVNISLNLWQEELNVYISVIDNGPGIPKEYLQKIFDPFFRVPTGNRHNVKGFGLGLSFAHLVMKQHNGTIKANNLADKGCEIRIEFPT